MLYNRCAEVDEEFWRALAQADPEEIARRTGVRRHENIFRFPYFNQEAVVDLDRQRVFRAAAPEEEPGFRLCLITVLYLLFVDNAGLGPPVSPLELTGATTFSKAGGPMPFPVPLWRTGSAGIWPVFWRWAAAWGQKGGPAAMAPWPSRSIRG